MSSTILNLLSVLVAALATTLVLELLLRRTERLPVDRPNERSLHQQPIPRIGGLALFPAVALTVLLLDAWSESNLVPLTLASVLFVVSIVDDWRSLPAGLRFGSHFVVSAGFAIWIAGLSPLALAGAVAIAWMTNLYNFMDGANGLAGGMTVIGFAILGIASGDGLLACALVGAGLAFLRYNFDPARVFLGDAGSIPVGFLAGVICFVGVVRGLWPLWFPLLVFAPFVVDATATLVKRMLRGEKFWMAHRQHYYQRLIRMGWSHRRLAVSEYGLMAVCGALALFLRSASASIQLVGVAMCIALHVALMIWVDRRWHATGMSA